MPTFEKAEAVCFGEKRETWRSDNPEKAWRRAVDRYVLPKLGAMPVDEVGSAAVYEVLRPIALAGKHATVQMAGAAITAVLEWARIAEFRAEGSPVATVRRRLPKRVGGRKHYDALHFSEVAGAAATEPVASMSLVRRTCGAGSSASWPRIAPRRAGRWRRWRRPGGVTQVRPMAVGSGIRRTRGPRRNARHYRSGGWKRTKTPSAARRQVASSVVTVR